MGKNCEFYDKGVCNNLVRQEGLYIENFYDQCGDWGSCADCDALTEDELEALCDLEIMGLTDLCIDVCQRCSHSGCMDCVSPSCSRETVFYKFTPMRN